MAVRQAGVVYLEENKVRIFLCAFFLMLCAAAPAAADTLHLKNGNTVTGIIKGEYAQSVEIELDCGSITFLKDELRSMERTTTPDEAVVLREEWEAARQQKITQASQAETKVPPVWNDDKIRAVFQKQVAQENRAVEEMLRRPQRSGFVRENPRQEEKTVSEALAPAEIQLRRDDSNRLLADVWINERTRLTLVVDTGASFVYLTNKAGEKLFSSGALPRLPLIHAATTIVADGRKVSVSSVSIRSMRVGNMTARNVEATVAVQKGSDLPDADGLLGMSFLSRFNFGINYKKATLRLDKF
jgi:clan AA aspartic protease (TIGR02281 family)